MPDCTFMLDSYPPAGHLQVQSAGKCGTGVQHVEGKRSWRLTSAKLLRNGSTTESESVGESLLQLGLVQLIEGMAEMQQDEIADRGVQPLKSGGSAPSGQAAAASVHGFQLAMLTGT